MSQQRPTTLYRFFAEDGTLLYVGITSIGAARWKQHSKAQPWWHEVATTTTEHFPTREQALAAEKTAIIEEHPLHNVVHNGRHSAPAPPEPLREPEPLWEVVNRRSHNTRNSTLWLTYEIRMTSCVDELDGYSGMEQLRHWLHRLGQTENNEVPILWFIEGDAGIFELAPFQTHPHIDDDDGHFLTHYYWPERVVPIDQDGERVDFFSLPVKQDRYPEFEKALDWRPSPLQPTMPLKSLVASRRLSGAWQWWT